MRIGEDQQTHPNEIPHRNMPTQDLRRWYIPFLLRLEHEQHPRDNKAGPADDLGQPVDAVGGGDREARVDRGQGGQAGDPEDGGAEELGEAGEEAEFVEVVGAEGGEGRDEGEWEGV